MRSRGGDLIMRGGITMILLFIVIFMIGGAIWLISPFFETLFPIAYALANPASVGVLEVFFEYLPLLAMILLIIGAIIHSQSID